MSVAKYSISSPQRAVNSFFEMESESSSFGNKGLLCGDQQEQLNAESLVILFDFGNICAVNTGIVFFRKLFGIASGKSADFLALLGIDEAARTLGIIADEHVLAGKQFSSALMQCGLVVPRSRSTIRCSAFNRLS